MPVRFSLGAAVAFAAAGIAGEFVEATIANPGVALPTAGFSRPANLAVADWLDATSNFH